MALSKLNYHQPESTNLHHCLPNNLFNIARGRGVTEFQSYVVESKVQGKKRGSRRGIHCQGERSRAMGQRSGSRVGGMGPWKGIWAQKGILVLGKGI
jgi:hypothetical protein